MKKILYVESIIFYCYRSLFGSSWCSNHCYTQFAAVRSDSMTMVDVDYPGFPFAGRFRGIAVLGACKFCPVFTPECSHCLGVNTGANDDIVHPFCTDTSISWIPIEFRRRLVARLNYAIAMDDSTGWPDRYYDSNAHTRARREVVRIASNLKTLAHFRTASREPLILIIIARSGVF